MTDRSTRSLEVALVSMDILCLYFTEFLCHILFTPYFDFFIYLMRHDIQRMWYLIIIYSSLVTASWRRSRWVCVTPQYKRHKGFWANLRREFAADSLSDVTQYKLLTPPENEALLVLSPPFSMISSWAPEVVKPYINTNILSSSRMSCFLYFSPFNTEIIYVVVI